MKSGDSGALAVQGEKLNVVSEAMGKLHFSSHHNHTVDGEATGLFLFPSLPSFFPSFSPFQSKVSFKVYSSKC